MNLLIEIEQILRKRAPELCLAVMDLSVAERINAIDAIEADVLLRTPLHVHPYPAEACRERERLRTMSRDERRRTIEISDYDSGWAHRGRREFSAWYALVVSDLELLHRTFWGTGPHTQTARKLAQQLLTLATGYTEMAAAWPQDRMYPNGAPCTTPQLYQRLARRWLAPVAVARGWAQTRDDSGDFWSRPEVAL